MNSSTIQEERKFLHDIATPMALVKLILQRLADDLANPEKPAQSAAMREWVGKAIHSMQKLEELHADRKARITLAEKT